MLQLNDAWPHTLPGVHFEAPSFLTIDILDVCPRETIKTALCIGRDASAIKGYNFWSEYCSYRIWNFSDEEPETPGQEDLVSLQRICGKVIAVDFHGACFESEI